MRLALLQTKQNELYDFLNPNPRSLSKEEAKQLRIEMIEQNFKMVRDVAKQGCDLIVTTEAINYPGRKELIADSYSECIPESNDEFFKRWSQLAKEANSYIVLGAYQKRINAKGEEKFYNCAVVYNRQGEQIACYDKIHLAGSENDDLTAGKDYVTVDTDFGRLGVLVCFDAQFPESARELAIMGADLIVCPTWGWEAVYGHARAYENGIYFASAMAVPHWGDIDGIRTPSELEAPDGKILAQGSFSQAQIVLADFDPTLCRFFRKERMSLRHPDTYKHIAKQ